jgi:uncharacterized membrane protein YgcG
VVLLSLLVLLFSDGGAAFAADVPFSSLAGKWIIQNGEGHATTQTNPSVNPTASATIGSGSATITVLSESGNSAELKIDYDLAATCGVDGYIPPIADSDAGSMNLTVTRNGNEFTYKYNKPANNVVYVLTYNNDTLNLKGAGVYTPASKQNGDYLENLVLQSANYNFEGNLSRSGSGGAPGGGGDGTGGGNGGGDGSGGGAGNGGKTGNGSGNGCDTGIAFAGLIALAVGFAVARFSKTR